MSALTMADVIVPKSDQWNADDFIAGPRTFTIREVQLRGGQEQPVNILLEGTEKAYRPCKSMSRVLVQAWGPDAKVYVGRSLTLYRDPTVKWGGLEVGGIRISHLSDINGKMQMQLTATRGQRKPHIIMPLIMDQSAPQEDAATRWTNAYLLVLDDQKSIKDLDAFAKSKSAKLEELKLARPELHEKIIAALAVQRTNLQAAAVGFEDDDLTRAAQPQQEAAE